MGCCPAGEHVRLGASAARARASGLRNRPQSPITSPGWSSPRSRSRRPPRRARVCVSRPTSRATTVAILGWYIGGRQPRNSHGSAALSPSSKRPSAWRCSTSSATTSLRASTPLSKTTGCFPQREALSLRGRFATASPIRPLPGGDLQSSLYVSRKRASLALLGPDPP
jgi:hypothetical protein